MIDVLTQHVAGQTDASPAVDQLAGDGANTPNFGGQFLTSSIVNTNTRAASTDTVQHLGSDATPNAANSSNGLSVQSLLLAGRPGRSKLLKSPSDDSLRFVNPFHYSSPTSSSLSVR
uniref:Uncharacterized protein n=1 Tax=Panagrellus redivivus TaxID=6233 RepID=A0A7E4UQN1_PANRE